MAKTKRDYYYQYQPRIENKIENVALKKLKPGNLVEFTYYKRGKRDTGKFPRLVMVLEPNYDDKFHCLKLNELPINTFKMLLNRFKTRYESVKRKAISELRAPTFKTIENPRSFYNNHLKNDSRIKRYTPYRTYHVDNIRHIKLVNFDFEVDLEPPELPGSELEL